MQIIARPYQIDKAIDCWNILRETGYVFLAGKPRSGKTLTAILVCEMSNQINSILVLTKKNAIPGWMLFINNYPVRHNYHVINYEQIGTAKTVTVGRTTKTVYSYKVNPEDYDLVIVDESHNTGAFPVPTGRHKIIKQVCKNMPHIHLSGTAIVESPNSIYHQMNISKFTPWSHSTFYEFFREFGQPYCIEAAGRRIQQYDKYKPELLDEIDKFTVYMTQEEAGISAELQAVDKEHFVTLDADTRDVYNYFQQEKICFIKGFAKPLLGDSIMKLRVSLHMLESGVAKFGDDYVLLGNTEKVDYILNTFGDSADVGIMCHFIGEKMLLQKYFKKAKIYSSNADAEGVDLSHLSHFVIMSSDYSGSKFIQRRDRIINTNGSNTLIVHHILVKNAISHQVYKKVSKKEDFNNSTYERTRV